MQTGQQPRALNSDAYRDFRAKMKWLYDQLAAHKDIGPKYAYPWVTHFYQGFLPREASQLAASACLAAKKEPVGAVKWQAKSAGAAGLLSVDVDIGLRAKPENIALMRAMQKAGITVYVVTASHRRYCKA